jgi:serine protease Do
MKHSLLTWLVLIAVCGAPLAQEEDETLEGMPALLNSDRVSMLQGDLAKGASAVLSAFAPVVSNTWPSVATILADGAPVALGTVVDADGLLITKASQLDGGSITCRLADGRRLRTALLGKDDEHDLALIKIPARDLEPVAWREDGVPTAGHWVVTPGPSPTPLAAGVVSAAERSWRMRRQDRPRGFLGVQLEPGESNTVRIARVIGGLAADKAGIEAGDVIARVGDEMTESVDQVIRTLGGTPPDTTVTIGLLRDDRAITVDATLGKMSVRTPELRWGGGPFSERRFEFPNVLPHDTTLLPTQCGGPLLDMNGQAVGINIARALRVASYALPARDVQRVLEQLKAGAPTDVAVSQDPVAPLPTAEGDSPAGARDGEEGDAEDDALSLFQRWIQAIHGHDPGALEKVTEELIEQSPAREARVVMQSARVFLGVLRDDERGYRWARRLLDSDLEAKAELLNEISWFIFTDERVENRDLDCGMELARLAVKRSRGRDAAILDTLARGHFEQGELEQAIKVQTRAVKRARGQGKAVIRETLDRYKRARTAI